MNINNDYLGCFGKAKHSLKPTAIVIHHTATRSPSSTRRALKSKNCSTHYEVDTDGTIYCYRLPTEQADHCGSSNCHCIGIDVTHETGKEFPQVQIQSVKELVNYLCNKFDISLEIHEQLSGIYPHRALGSTICPDNFNMEWLL